VGLHVLHGFSTDENKGKATLTAVTSNSSA
jgi:hypothetical protein